MVIPYDIKLRDAGKSFIILVIKMYFFLKIMRLESPDMTDD